MHVLLAASADSLWVKKYIEEVLLPARHKITILSPQSVFFREFYEASGVRVCTTMRNVKPRKNNEYVSSSSQRRLKKLAFAIGKRVLPRSVKDYIRTIKPRRAVLRAINGLPEFDALHVHYVTPGLDYVYAPLLKKNKGNLVLTYWGSDLFRNTSGKCNVKLLEKASAIVCVSESLKAYFRSIYGADFDDKLHVLDFGVSVYDAIDRLEQKEMRHAEIRRFFSIPEGKLCVMAGYNANSGQQHLDILQAIDRLPQSVKSKIHVLLQYSYNYTDDESYYEKINNNLNKLTCSWGIIDKFLDENQSAQLRSCVDIFIHAQITDALSASMLEYLYAGAIVINGAWLKYHELESRGINYLHFDDFAQLTSMIEDVILNYDVYKNKSLVNREALHAMNSWSAVKVKWLELYGPSGFSVGRKCDI